MRFNSRPGAMGRLWLGQLGRLAEARAVRRRRLAGEALKRFALKRLPPEELRTWLFEAGRRMR